MVVTFLVLYLTQQQCLGSQDVVSMNVKTYFEEGQFTPFPRQCQCHSECMVYNNDIPKYVTIQRGLWLIMSDVYTAGERNRTKK